jgi:zinc resistance-associated protein
MKATKMSLVVLLALALTAGLAAASWARSWGPGMGWGGPGAMNLSPEQAGKLFDLRQKFMNDTAELRKQMWINRSELAALWRAEKPDQKAIQAKVKTLNDLRGQMQQKMVPFRLEARKIAPQLARGFGHGMGWGRGFMGPGGHGGFGCPFSGGGPGGPPPAAPAK